MKEIARNEQGYPLDENGQIDWALTSKEKQEVLDKYKRSQGSGKTRSVRTNITPKKKKRK